MVAPALFALACGGEPGGGSDAGASAPGSLAPSSSSTASDSDTGDTESTGDTTGASDTHETADMPDMPGGATDPATTDPGTTGEPPPGGSPGCGREPQAPPQTVEVDGETRSFLLELPANYDPFTAYSLILGYHGTGHQGADARAQMQLLAHAGGEALVVYPDGALQAPVWQFPGGAGVTEPERDLEFFDALIALIAARYCLDEARVFAAGFSQGAFFVNALACERPAAVTAIAPSGGGGPWQCQPGVMAAMIVIGEDDDISGANSPYGYGNSAQMSRDLWVAGNGCGSATMPVEPAPCVEYDCPDRPVVFCEFAGGHTWWPAASAGITQFFAEIGP